MKFVIVRRLSDMMEMEIPERHLQETLKKGFEFVSEVSFATDVVEKPEEALNDLLECPICNEEFKTAEDLNRHKSVHLEVSEFECPICNKVCASKAGLTAHKRSHK